MNRDTRKAAAIHLDVLDAYISEAGQETGEVSGLMAQEALRLLRECFDRIGHNERQAMIIIDKVIRESDGEIMGVEIQIGVEHRFISRYQDLWPGVRTGRFPPPSGINDRFLRVGLLALTCAKSENGG